MTPDLNTQPDIKVSIKQTFGIDTEMEVNAFSKKAEYVPDIDKNYKFDRDTTPVSFFTWCNNNSSFLVNSFFN